MSHLQTLPLQMVLNKMPCTGRSPESQWYPSPNGSCFLLLEDKQPTSRFPGEISCQESPVAGPLSWCIFQVQNGKTKAVAIGGSTVLKLQSALKSLGRLAGPWESLGSRIYVFIHSGRDIPYVCGVCSCVCGCLP